MFSTHLSFNQSEYPAICRNFCSCYFSVLAVLFPTWSSFDVDGNHLINILKYNCFACCRWVTRVLLYGLRLPIWSQTLWHFQQWLVAFIFEMSFLLLDTNTFRNIWNFLKSLYSFMGWLSLSQDWTNSLHLHRFALYAATSWCQADGLCEQLPSNVLLNPET